MARNKKPSKEERAQQQLRDKAFMTQAPTVTVDTALLQSMLGRWENIHARLKHLEEIEPERLIKKVDPEERLTFREFLHLCEKMRALFPQIPCERYHDD